MQLGIGLWIDTPQPVAGGSAPPPTPFAPTHVYYFDNSHICAVFIDTTVILDGLPPWTAGGVEVFEAFQNYGPDSVDIVWAEPTEASSLMVPADGATPTRATDGAKVAAGEYEFEVPPPLVNTDPPAINGDPVIGQIITCSTGAWSGYGYPYADYVLGFQWSPNGITDWQFLYEGETYELQPGDMGRFIRAVSSASVGGSEYTTAYGNPVGPVIYAGGEQVYDTPGGYTFTTPVPGYYLIECVGAGGNGGEGDSSSQAGGGGGGGAYAAGIFLFAANTKMEVYVSNPGDESASYVSDVYSSKIVRATDGFSGVGGDSGAGGVAVDCIGDTKYDGGNGSPNRSEIGGGGGGAAGAAGPGADGLEEAGGSGTYPGGNGGDGAFPGNENIGQPGQSPGGGGGGGPPGGGSNGSGGNGLVRITWPPP